jgi:putative hydrolase of the HAD superfamily
MALTTIGFDADDTLWYHESYYRMTQDHFARLLADHADPDHLHDRLLEAERRNLGHYGFGVKGFVLSMIETAIEVTEGRVPARVISDIMAAGREMLSHPIDLLPDAHRIILITKGDLMDQDRKLAQSGLGDMFYAVDVVSDKTPAVYARAFARHGTGASQAMMVGDSVKSDVLPAIEAGAWGVHVPSGVPWALDTANPPIGHPRYRALPGLGALIDLVTMLDG